MKNTKIKLSPLIAILLCLIALPVLMTQASGAGFVKIELFENSKIENEKVLLGEIAHISGDDPAQLQKIRDIVVGNAPIAGKDKHISRDLVISRLKSNGFSLANIQVHAPDTVKIYRCSKKVSDMEIEKIVLAFLDKNIPWDRNNVNVKDICIKNDMILPNGRITYKVVPQPNSDYLGITPFSINFYVNGKFEKRAWVTANIEVMEEVVVTNKPLGRYKLITEEDIQLKRVNLAKLSSNVITRSEEVLGKRTKRKIDSNVALRSDLVELPPLIKKGDIVRIIVESDGLKVTALGKAKEKGRKGEMIKVVNVDSTKAVYATVMDSSNVKVDY